MRKEVALVYFVAGISSRFGGKMKQFAKIGPAGETLIEYSLNQALKSKFSKIVFVVGNKTEKRFKEKFGRAYKGIPVFYALQKFDEGKRDKPWGTAAALVSAAKLLDCPFVVCNGDDIYGERTFKILVEHLRKSSDAATVGYRLIDVLPERGVTNRGIFRTSGGYIKSIREVFKIKKSDLKATKTKASDLCSMGIFSFHPNMIKFLREELADFKELHKGNKVAECVLEVELSKFIKEGRIKMRAYRAVDKWVGVTNPRDEKKAKEKLLLMDRMRKSA